MLFTISQKNNSVGIEYYTNQVNLKCYLQFHKRNNSEGVEFE